MSLKKQFGIVTLTLAALFLFILTAPFLILPKLSLVSFISTTIPANYDWQQEKTSGYALKDMYTKSYEKTPICTDNATIKYEDHCLGEFGGKKYISISLAEKVMPIHFSQSDGILYASFRYLKMAMKENSKKVLFFTPFSKHTEKMDACVLSVEDKLYVPVNLIAHLDYCDEKLIGDSTESYFHPILGCAYVGKIEYNSISINADKKLNWFSGTLIGVSKDGAGIYRKYGTGDIYVDYDSLFYMYEAYRGLTCMMS